MVTDPEGGLSCAVCDGDSGEVIAKPRRFVDDENDAEHSQLWSHFTNVLKVGCRELVLKETRNVAKGVNAEIEIIEGPIRAVRFLNRPAPTPDGEDYWGVEYYISDPRLSTDNYTWTNIRSVRKRSLPIVFSLIDLFVALWSLKLSRQIGVTDVIWKGTDPTGLAEDIKEYPAIGIALADHIPWGWADIRITSDRHQGRWNVTTQIGALHRGDVHRTEDATAELLPNSELWAAFQAIGFRLLNARVS